MHVVELAWSPDIGLGLRLDRFLSHSHYVLTFMRILSFCTIGFNKWHACHFYVSLANRWKLEWFACAFFCRSHAHTFTYLVCSSFFFSPFSPSFVDSPQLLMAGGSVGFGVSVHGVFLRLRLCEAFFCLFVELCHRISIWVCVVVAKFSFHHLLCKLME